MSLNDSQMHFDFRFTFSIRMIVCTPNLFLISLITLYLLIYD